MYIDNNILFSGDYISALRGCCPLKFLHALQTDPDLLVHTPKGNGGPPKNFNRKNSKFGLKFSVLSSITSVLLGVSSRNFFQSTCRKAGVINWVQFLEGPPQKIWQAKKTVQNSSRFLTTFDFDREYLRNASTSRKSEKYFINYNSSHVGWKKVGALWSINEKVIKLNAYKP